jgi:hypothetical protein
MFHIFSVEQTSTIRQCNGGFLSGETKHSVEPDGDTGFDSQTYEDEVKVIAHRKCNDRGYLGRRLEVRILLTFV